MYSARHRLILGAGILFAASLPLACNTDSSGTPDGGLTSLLTGGNQSGGSGADPATGDPTADPTSPPTNEPTDPGTSDPDKPGGDSGGTTGTPPNNNTIIADPRPVTLVTSLEDYESGEPEIVGSLRWAVQYAPTPGIIRFQVGGPINLKRWLSVKRPELEIDGSTAPNGGITIQRQQFDVRDTHDVVVKHLRFRSGDGFKSDAERVAVHGEYYDVNSPNYAGGFRSLGIAGATPCRNVRIENCSIQNATDDNASVWGDCGDVVFYRCLFSGGYTHVTKAMACGDAPGKPQPNHPRWLTLQQCLFVDQWGRMPDLGGETAHLVNNVIIRPMQGGRFYSARVNVVGNCLYSMPNHPWYGNADRVLVAMDGTTPDGGLFVSGNLLDGVFDHFTKIVGIANQGQTPLPDRVFRPEAHPGLPTGIVPAHQALIDVLTNAGCKGPGRDEIDLTVIDRAAGFVGVDAATVR